jgi:hypothetical protein
MARQRSPGPEFQPEIRIGRIGSLPVYQISEHELETLAQGSPNSTYLNLAIALLSAAISFIIALATTNIESQRLFTVFVVFAVIGSVVGVVLSVIWYRGSRSVADLVETIRKRLPPEGEQAPTRVPPPT